MRVELREMRQVHAGSIYASLRWDLAPAFCRIDLLESRPGAADRMHWHPGMVDGEPGARSTDADLTVDPVAWVEARLHAPEILLRGVELDPQVHADAAGLSEEADTITGWVARGLERMRRPWPEVTYDARGLA
ncbi:hypothetical protein [Actinomycetospora corticicola]|uniref:Uncharacterized protein n=1 Tax=Actinomycetospora corticicola TaxID=663602 RepID=A0A7Y9J4I5_9PSEU|nr:hypothetical protein [Actinomycetospora corticicola]NYD35122.1 hypothetical protein [Actinomycetospora corticicola]